MAKKKGRAPRPSPRRVVKERVRRATKTGRPAPPAFIAAGIPTRFPPGVSGNPSGRPRDSIRSAIRKKASEVVPGDSRGRTFAEVAAEIYWFKALKSGGTEAIRALEGIVLEVDGPLPKERTSGEGDIGNTLMTIDQIRELVRIAREARARRLSEQNTIEVGEGQG